MNTPVGAISAIDDAFANGGTVWIGVHHYDNDLYDAIPTEEIHADNPKSSTVWKEVHLTEKCKFTYFPKRSY